MNVTSLEKPIVPESPLLTRVEEKLAMPSRLAPAFLQLLSARLKPSYPSEGTHYNLIESTYYDTDSLDLFQDHFRRLEERFKLRARRYAPNGEWLFDEAVVEIKAKRRKVTRKSRITASLGTIEALGRGHPLEDSVELRRRNLGLGKGAIAKRVEKINELVLGRGLSPICKVAYRRLAFEGNGMRVTIDERVQSHLVREIPSSRREAVLRSPAFAAAQTMRSRVDLNSELLLELKHVGADLAWLKDFLLAHGAREVRYSKYCSAIAGALGVN